MRTIFESAAKVARRCASCGEAARRRRGGDDGSPAADDFVGEDGIAAKYNLLESHFMTEKEWWLPLSLSDFSEGS